SRAARRGRRRHLPASVAFRSDCEAGGGCDGTRRGNQGNAGTDRRHAQQAADLRSHGKAAGKIAQGANRRIGNGKLPSARRCEKEEGRADGSKYQTQSQKGGSQRSDRGPSLLVVDWWRRTGGRSAGGRRVVGRQPRPTVSRRSAS